MCAAVVEHVAVEGDVRAERRRILDTLLEDLDGLAERGVAALRAEIPAYGEGDARFVEDLRDQVRSHYRVKLAALLEDRMVTLRDIAFVRAAATRRARAGLRAGGLPQRLPRRASRRSGRRSSSARGRPRSGRRPR